MEKTYIIQRNKTTKQSFITIPRVIMTAKNWKEKTEIKYLIGPSGEVILREVIHKIKEYTKKLVGVRR